MQKSFSFINGCLVLQAINFDHQLLIQFIFILCPGLVLVGGSMFVSHKHIYVGWRKPLGLVSPGVGNFR